MRFLSQYRHLLQIPQCVVIFNQDQDSFLLFPSCLLPLLLRTPESRSAPLSVQFNQQRDSRPCTRFPSWGAVTGNCLCNLMTTYLYLAEKVVARICPAQFFWQFQCLESHRQSPERYIGPDRIWVEVSSTSQGYPLEASFQGITQTSLWSKAATRSTAPTAPPTCGRCDDSQVIVRQENKHERL